MVSLIISQVKELRFKFLDLIQGSETSLLLSR